MLSIRIFLMAFSFFLCQMTDSHFSDHDLATRLSGGRQGPAATGACALLSFALPLPSVGSCWEKCVLVLPISSDLGLVLFCFLLVLVKDTSCNLNHFLRVPLAEFRLSLLKLLPPLASLALCKQWSWIWEFPTRVCTCYNRVIQNTQIQVNFLITHFSMNVFKDSLHEQQTFFLAQCKFMF